MVTIIDYRVSQNSDGKPFCSLVLQGDMELVQSKQTGNYYATARKTSITSTFDESTCKALIGQKIPGSIVKKEVEAYEYIVPETGEIVTLEYSYVFVPEGREVEQAVFA